MDNTFIKNMVSYFYDEYDIKKLNIIKDSFVNDSYNYIKELFDYVYKNENDLYYEVYSYCELRKRDILYNILMDSVNTTYNNYLADKVHKDLFESEIGHIVTECIKYIEENPTSGNPVIESSDEKKGILSNAFDIAKNITIWAGQSAYEHQTAAIITIIVAFLATFYNLKWVNKNVAYKVSAYIAKLGDLVRKGARFISNDKAVKVKRAILDTNFDYCAKKCANVVDWKNLSSFISLALSKNSDTLHTAKAEEQAKCLIDCYLNHIIEQTTYVITNYTDCLRNTGQFGSMDVQAGFSILLRRPVSDACTDYYKYLKELEGEFNEAIDYLFRNYPQEKQTWINKFNNSISVKASGVPRSNDGQKQDYKKPYDNSQKQDYKKPFDNKQQPYNKKRY